MAMGRFGVMLIHLDLNIFYQPSLKCCEELVSPGAHFQSRIFIGRTDAEAEDPILWPPDVKN